MEFLRRSLLQAQVFLNQMTVTQKWLIASLIIILLLSGYLVLQYAARPQMIPITEFAAEQLPEVRAQLEREGIPVVLENGQVLVPYNRHIDSLVVLHQRDLIAVDSSRAFDQLIERYSPWFSSDHNRLSFLIAKQKVLSSILRRINGVRSADVLIAESDQQGFGQHHQNPTASVRIEMEGRKRLSKEMVEGVAGLVSKAVPGMKETHVTVVDASTGHKHTVDDPDKQIPSETLAYRQDIETRQRQRIEQQLDHIIGVKVQVNAQIDPMLHRKSETFTYEKTQPLRFESERREQKTDGSDRGEPGPRSNTGDDIEQGGGTNRTFLIEEIETQFADKPIIERTESREVGNQVTRFDVSVGVPRSYILAVAKLGKPDGESPDHEEIEETRTEELKKVENLVKPLIQAKVPGSLQVEVFNDAVMVTTVAEEPPNELLDLLERPWFKPVGLTALALVSLALMFGMVRKATQQPPLPSVEELRGVPPTLRGDSDLAGLAEETEQAMGGIEVDEDEMRSRKIAEQIAEMIKSSPLEAVSLLKKWIRPAE